MKTNGIDMNITNDIITAYIETLYKSENPELQALREFAEEKRVPIILKDTEGLLLNLMRLKRPEKILEIGAAVGYSACRFADECKCKVVTIESDKEAFDTARSNIKNLGFEDTVSIVHGDAREVLKELYNEYSAKEISKFDVVFIDAAKSHYKEFWDLSVPLCNDNAMIICDNVLMKGMTASDQYDPKKKYKTSIRKMREFISYINNLDYADTCIIPVGDGISLSVIEPGSNINKQEA